jgi:galactokinase
MTATPKLADLQQAFQRRFAAPHPRVFRAPGRTNLIGEHTDYNDGFVMPVAIDRATWVACAPRLDSTLRVFSEHFGEMVLFNPEDTSPAPRRDWSDYVRGVALALVDAKIDLVGADLLIRGDVPLGAGLSSSASLEVAIALALTSLTGNKIPPLEIARLCQQAENEFVGARCGIMDQFVACLGRAGYALFLDCRTLEHSAVRLPENVALVLCNTMVKHEIAAGEYNARRAGCEEAVARLARAIPGVRALRDVTPAQVEEHRNLLPGKLMQRVRHVTTENRRVLAARDALECGDLKAMGRLMRESHDSLRDDYEVSCRELDVIVNFASAFDGCFGARMTGGGFGGCTINLVDNAKTGEFAAHIERSYQKAIGLAPEIYVCDAVNGAEEVI